MKSSSNENYLLRFKRTAQYELIDDFLFGSGVGLGFTLLISLILTY